MEESLRSSQCSMHRCVVVVRSERERERRVSREVDLNGEWLCACAWYHAGAEGIGVEEGAAGVLGSEEDQLHAHEERAAQGLSK